jgi:RIO kinase 2
LAAEKEFRALQLAYRHGVAVPEPISQNRHAIVMGIIEGAELGKWREISKPEGVLKEVLRNVRKTYVKAGAIHADLSEYNIILKPDMHILIIDWPQYVLVDHPNAEQLLMRDVRNVLSFFSRRFGLKVKVRDAYDYVTGESRTLKLSV